MHSFNYRMVALLILSAILAACQSPATEPRSVEKYRAAYIANIQIRWEIYDMELRLTRMCMEDAGFAVHPAELTSNNPNRRETEFNPLVPEFTAVPDRDTAYAVGYGDWLTRQYLLDEEPVPFEDLSSQDQQDYYQALQGPDDETPTASAELHSGRVVEWWVGDGCRARAQDALLGDAYEYLAHWSASIGVAADQAIFNDHRIRTAEQDWSACMAAEGHPDLISPRSAFLRAAMRESDYIPPMGTDEATRQAGIEEWEQFQTELAIADYECQERFDLYRIYDEVFWELRIDAMSIDEHLAFSFHEKAEQILEHGQTMIATGELTTP